MPARATRSKAKPLADGKKKRHVPADNFEHDEESGREDDIHEDAYEDADDASEVESLDSDALDEDDVKPASRKRKRPAATAKKAPAKNAGKKTSPKKAGASPRKKRKSAKDEEAEDEDYLELEEGQEVVGVVVQAPKTGRVPPGQISKNTLDFLSELKKPECNDREWYVYSFSEPVYRLAEGEWKAFVEEFTDLLVEVDPQIPHLPPKDVIHRIYRDVRFSNDKTPYKTGFSASFSRSGRKGIFAACESLLVSLLAENATSLLTNRILVKGGGESLIAAGSWCPGKNELQTIRNNLLRSTRRLRQIISAPEFEALFGPAHPHPKGGRQNVFGFEDELKVAPKGVDKTHKDIDLLKCRSFAVIHKFTDQQVLAPDFKKELARIVQIVRPFVHCLNDLMTIQDADSSGSEDEPEDGEEDQDDDDDADDE
ncbi:uncharacterized protein TRAVEDRAFT_136292 [Trametes versicolor FP-101664 SS1]|uniref:Uncharacterized protein n=1 Tax=Trametes versicolor (strain FP-101664) TaxID=717944 RepID=R7S8F7_TRAVS|nr:uncharacterized protein TRAVEDRAFT_136292 [Trametes versicolor FP-101664 SS1]EIW51975.1 hypothetical protein TRAVEDRAFT_136292 [Trametes versicolor FP-101664 SS1]